MTAPPDGTDAQDAPGQTAHAALDALYRAHHPELLRIALTKVEDEHLAEEAVQTAYRRALK